jgi:hypothetical protein
MVVESERFRLQNAQDRARKTDMAKRLSDPFRIALEVNGLNPEDVVFVHTDAVHISDTPDAGIRVVVHNDLDLMRLDFDLQPADLPIRLDIGGNLICNPRVLNQLASAGKTMSVGREIQVIVDKGMSDDEKNSLLDHLQQLPGISYNKILLVEKSGIMSEGDLID